MSIGLDIPIRAVDEATAVFRKVSDEAQRSMGAVEEATRKVELTHEQMTAGMKEVVTGFSGVATSAFALYSSYDRVQDMTVSVDRANLQVKSTFNSLEDAQRRYNAVVEKYGADSEQAVAAAKDVELAQERYQVAVERAQMMQNNLNNTMVQSAISVIPTAITMINSLVHVKQAWAAAQAALNVVLNANPILLIVTAIGALVAVMVYAYNTCEPFRNAVNQIGATLMSIFKPAIEAVSNALSWLWSNIVQPLINGLKWLSDSLASVAGWFGNVGKSASSSSSYIDSYTQKMIDLHRTVGQPPSTGLIESFEYLDKTVKGIEPPEIAIQSMGNVSVPFGGFAAGSAPVTVNVNSPLVNVEGSADRAVIDEAAEKVLDKLRNVLVEASSQSAPGIHKRIRTGGTLNVA
jgi:phage-related protein